jgi:hypothetical protein
MLEEMGHSVLVGALGPSSGIKGDKQGYSSRTFDRDFVQRQPVGKDRLRDRRHRPRTVPTLFVEVDALRMAIEHEQRLF